MSRNRNTWDLEDIERDIWKEAEEMVVKVRKQAVNTMLDSVSNYAPVSSDTPEYATETSGNLLGNTIVSVGTPDFSTNDLYDPARWRMMIEGMKVLNRAGPWADVYIQNNTEYNLQAEFEGWFFTPAYHYWEKAVNDVEMDMEMG